MITSKKLAYMYETKKLSMHAISLEIGCSAHKVDYWMKKHNIPKRDRSDAGYQMHNPNGDPFHKTDINTLKLAELYGVGMGLYWGEGTKASKQAVRLGNTDVHLINKFLEFLITIYKIDTTKLRFSIQTFSDCDVLKVEEYWQSKLGYGKEYFYKTIVTKSGSIGSYKRKSKYGVLTLYFSNVKLRNLLVDALPQGGVKYMSQ